MDITEQIPFETPKNWVWTRLSHIANIYTGNSISETEKKSKFTDVIGRYYIGTKDVDFNNRIYCCPVKLFQTKQIRADTSHEVSALLVIFVLRKNI